MKIKGTSYFKDPKNDVLYFENWVKKLEQSNDRIYERIRITTSLGDTNIYGWNTSEESAETLVIFPGARTTALIWDFDKGLDHLNLPLRIFLVETNGLPNLSDGSTPDIKTLDYGHWANEVLEALHIEKTFVAGSSFGGLICMKLGIVHPEKVKAAFLLNPGCLQPFSMTWKNLYYNILPLVKTNEKNVLKFLEKAVFCKPVHQLSPEAEKMLVDYEVFAIKQYKDNTQKPYYMGKELAEVQVDTYLLLGDKDLLFPYQKSIENANRNMHTLKEIQVFENVGHGIETFDRAIQYIGERIKSMTSI